MISTAEWVKSGMMLADVKMGTLVCIWMGGAEFGFPVNAGEEVWCQGDVYNLGLV